jgi:glycosyltransferase involved in cell wall biosynthesis
MPMSKAAAQSALSQGIPYVVSPYGELSDNPKQKPTVRQRVGDALGDNRLLKKASALHAVSHREGDHLAHRGYHDRVIRAPLGISSEDWNRSDHSTDPLADHPNLANRRLMLYLGRLAHPLEGLVPWLKACDQLSDEMADWLVVLAGPAHRAWRAILEAGLRRGGATERVIILESPSLDAHRALLHRAELVVAPSVRDNVPVSVMQALAAGVPVIASDRLYLDDLDDLAAVHVTSPNRKKLLNAMTEVVDQSAEDRQGQARAAQAAVAARFDWAQRISAFLAMYQSVAKG